MNRLQGGWLKIIDDRPTPVSRQISFQFRREIDLVLFEILFHGFDFETMFTFAEGRVPAR